jgi:uncharacterized membrane protein
MRANNTLRRRKMANAHTPQEKGVKSTASIGGHPIHPLLVPFPIAFLIGALLTDLAYLGGVGDPFWARASLWLIGGGFVGGVLAAIFGLTDFITIQRVREHKIAWVHFIGNATVLVLALINWLLRLSSILESVPLWGLVLSIITAAILLITGWAGGELAYRHKIGVIDTDSPNKP